MVSCLFIEQVIAQAKKRKITQLLSAFNIINKIIIQPQPLQALPVEPQHLPQSISGNPIPHYIIFSTNIPKSKETTTKGLKTDDFMALIIYWYDRYWC